MTEIDHDRYLKEMRKRIRHVYRQKGARGPNKISQGEDLRATVKHQRKTLKTIPPDIKLWLALFDEAVAFWLVVWAIYRDQIQNPSDKRLICLMALGGRIFQDMLCVRELIVGGFFVQSNVVARSLIEAIDVMHLINSRPELAKDFEQIKTNDESSRFWHKYCSRDKIHKLVKQRWLWFFSNDENPSESFHGLREEYLDLMGMSVHPSFGASLASFMDSAEGHTDSIAKNAMGSVSHMSKFTIHLILLRVFEYGMLWAGPEISLYKSDNDFEPEPFLYENISKGLSVMFSIVHMIDRTSDKDPFYPGFQTYWPVPGRKQTN